MPFVIPVFIPHEGCPHRCVFCNQRTISGHGDHNPVSGSEVAAIIEEWLGYHRRSRGEIQVAFYGGSFTGLPLERQQELLGAVTPFIKKNRVATIRLSTRPDYISPEIISFLEEHYVTIVELGIQSLDDSVLEIAHRGHDALQAKTALEQLRQAGFVVGAQLMVGLPGETGRSLLETVSGVIQLQPDFARIYPVLVLRNSPLAAQYQNKKYHPLSLSKAVLKAAWLKQRLSEHDIAVVRMGLQPGPELEKALLAGPYHPAFGELVNARIMFKKTRFLLAGAKTGGASGSSNPIQLSINPKDLSAFRGLRSANIERLAELGLADSFELHFDSNQTRLTIK